MDRNLQNGGVDSEDQLLYRILAAARLVHGTLGSGFMESIYGRALGVELRNSGLQIDREKTIRIWYGPCLVGKHRLDLLVGRSVIIELKAQPGHHSDTHCANEFVLACIELPGRPAPEFRHNRIAMGDRPVEWCISKKPRRALRLLGAFLIPATT